MASRSEVGNQTSSCHQVPSARRVPLVRSLRRKSFRVRMGTDDRDRLKFTRIERQNSLFIFQQNNTPLGDTREVARPACTSTTPFDRIINNAVANSDRKTRRMCSSSSARGILRLTACLYRRRKIIQRLLPVETRGRGFNVLSVAPQSETTNPLNFQSFRSIAGQVSVFAGVVPVHRVVGAHDGRGLSDGDSHLKCE
jgi:hypothetical protein